MDTSLLDNTVTFASEPFPSLLDARILRALADMAFTHPTLVQTEAIPLILQGKDVLAKARTGSGKTAAYGLPAVQRVLSAKDVRVLQVSCCGGYLADADPFDIRSKTLRQRSGH